MPDSDALYCTLLKQEPVQRYTLGTVYEPMEVDTQDDFASAVVIMRAQRKFMALLQRGATLNKAALALLDVVVKAASTSTPLRLDITDVLTTIEKGQGIGDQHSNWDPRLGEIVDCYCMPCDVHLAGQTVKAGSWMLGVVWSPEYFSKIQSGERTGYSMGGLGRRKWVESLANAV